MPEFQFQQKFVDDFVKLATEQHFQQVPALQALKDLSSYGIDIGQDLQAGKIFKIIVFTFGQKNLIALCE